MIGQMARSCYSGTIAGDAVREAEEGNEAMNIRKSMFSLLAVAAVSVALVAMGAGAEATSDTPDQSAASANGFASLCTPAVMSSVASGLNRGVTIKKVPNGPQFEDGVRFVAASGKVPAFCQVTGSYVTNPETGKTANFIASFAEKWNGKYLQMGCSGACGYLLMNDPAAPPIVVTAQGYPGELMEKGYATFGDDLGHVLPSPMSMSFDWMKKPDGSIDEDALKDYLYRADRVLAQTGKAFTQAFYARQAGTAASISRSYFIGCSQGGREALIAATHFPEEFDGIISGAPAADLGGVTWHGMGRSKLAQQPGVTKLTDGQVAMLKSRIIDKCDAVDGVKDGLVQNPAACKFHPTRDLPICKAGQTSDSCVTKQQAELISTWFSGVTDEHGRVLQPGYTVSTIDGSIVTPIPAGIDVENGMRFAIGHTFDGQALSSARAGGPGPIDAFHIVLNGPAYQKYVEVNREGTVMAEDFDSFLQHGGKLLWYSGLSDPALTPYMSINRYKQLAAMHGGYSKLQKNIRFFSMPNVGHCGMGGEGPGNFDAIGTLESWVERGVAPDAIPARLNDPKTSNLIAGQIDWSKPAIRTMPLCAFPEMAHYKGHGDVNDAANWECRPTDKRMLAVGVSGREAGVVR